MRIAPVAAVTHVLMFVSLVAAPAHAQMAQPKDALDGVDAVALLNQGKEISGKPEFKVARGKFDYLFATAENKAAFEKNPEKYEIQLSGACARMGGGVTGNPAEERNVFSRSRCCVVCRTEPAGRTRANSSAAAAVSAGTFSNSNVTA